MSDQENDVPVSAMDPMRQPSKSILRDNTLPLMNDKRRVSFAPEVTLHKFDFVPSTKRRRTMGDVPQTDGVTSLDENDEGIDILSDSSASDSFETLERNADQIATQLGTFKEPGNDGVSARGSDDEAEEATMELTNQFSVHLSQAVTVESNVGPNGAASDIPSTNNANESQGEDQAPTLSSSEGEDEGNEDKEVGMDLTEVQQVGSFQPPIFKTLPPYTTAAKPSQNDEMTMDLTSTISHAVELNNEEMTMEFTQVPTKTETLSTLQMAVDTIKPSPTDDRFQAQTSPSESSEKNIAESGDSVPGVESSNSQPGQESSSGNGDSIDENIDSQERDIDQSTQEAHVSMELTQVPSKAHLNTNDNVQNIESAVLIDTNAENVTINNVLKDNSNNWETQHEDSESNKDGDNKSGNDTQVYLEAQSEVDGGQRISGEIQRTSESAFDQRGSLESYAEKQEGGVPSGVLDQENRDIQETLDNKLKELVVTTTIPLVDNTLNAESDSQSVVDYDQVSLSEFMTDIGIKFYDDLDIDANTFNRLSLSFTRNETNFTKNDYARSLPKLQLLELYEFSCEELNKNIQEGKKVFAEFNKTIEISNPQIFRDYYQADDHERLTLNMKLQLIKDLTRHQSKNTWYDWRIQLSQNLLQELEDRLTSLQEDEISLKEKLKSLKSTLQGVRMYHSELKVKLVNLFKVNEQLSNLSGSEVKSLKDELTELRRDLEAVRQRYSSKTDQQKELVLELSQLNDVKTNLKKELSDVQKVLANNKKYETDEISMIEMKFLVIQALSGLKYIDVKGSVMNFEFDKVVTVTIDFSNIQDPANIKYAITRSLSQAHIHNPEFFEAIIENSSAWSAGCKTVVDHFKTFRSQWFVVRRIDIDLFKLSLKFPTKILALSSKELKFQLSYYNHQEGIKMVLVAVIDMERLSEYPKNLVLTAQVIRSPTTLTGQSALSYVLNDAVRNNLICSENLLEVIIA